MSFLGKDPFPWAALNVLWIIILCLVIIDYERGRSASNRRYEALVEEVGALRSEAYSLSDRLDKASILLDECQSEQDKLLKMRIEAALKVKNGQ